MQSKMADRRRRRVKSSEDSEELSEESVEERELDKAESVPQEKATGSREAAIADSEYESAEEEELNKQSKISEEKPPYQEPMEEGQPTKNILPQIESRMLSKKEEPDVVAGAMNSGDRSFDTKEDLGEETVNDEIPILDEVKLPNVDTEAFSELEKSKREGPVVEKIDTELLKPVSELSIKENSDSPLKINETVKPVLENLAKEAALPVVEKLLVAERMSAPLLEKLADVENLPALEKHVDIGKLDSVENSNINDLLSIDQRLDNVESLVDRKLTSTVEKLALVEDLIEAEKSTVEKLSEDIGKFTALQEVVNDVSDVSYEIERSMTSGDEHSEDLDLPSIAIETPLDLEVEEDIESTNPGDEEGGVEEAADETMIEGDYLGDDDDDEDEDDEEDELDDDEEEWKEGERQQGDGQESQSQQLKEKPLDDDEDKRNPQYIPKKGGFYEHDDRLADDEEVKEEEKKPKKKLWKDEGKWSHDRFREEDQKPKSRDELVTAYGYDIRNEDGPPRARRRRRYGRGPNKYTRNWEDEDAYSKGAPRRQLSDFLPAANRGSRGGRGRAGLRGGRGRFGHNVSGDYGRANNNWQPAYQHRQEYRSRLNSQNSESDMSLPAAQNRTSENKINANTERRSSVSSCGSGPSVTSGRLHSDSNLNVTSTRKYSDSSDNNNTWNKRTLSSSSDPTVSNDQAVPINRQAATALATSTTSSSSSSSFVKETNISTSRDIVIERRVPTETFSRSRGLSDSQDDHRNVPRDDHRNSVTRDDHRNSVPRDDHRNSVPRDDHRNSVPRDDHRNSVPRDDHRTSVPRDDHRTSVPRDDHRTSVSRDDHRTSVSRDDHRTSVSRDDHRSGGPRDDHRSGGPRDDHRGGGPREDHRSGGPRDDHRGSGPRDDHRRIGSRDGPWGDGPHSNDNREGLRGGPRRGGPRGGLRGFPRDNPRDVHRGGGLRGSGPHDGPRGGGFREGFRNDGPRGSSRGGHFREGFRNDGPRDNPRGGHFRDSPRGGGPRGSTGPRPASGSESRQFQHQDCREDMNSSHAGGDAGHITRDMEQMSLKETRDNRPSPRENRDTRRDSKPSSGQHTSNSNQERRQSTIPPRLQEAAAAAAANRPKRYSSQRQRNVPDAPPFQPSPSPQAPAMIPPRFYDSGVEYAAVAETGGPGYQQPIYSEPQATTTQQQSAAPLLPPAPPPPQSFPAYTQPYQEPYGPMASPPRIFAPVTMATGTIATGQPVMPTPYISPNNSMINYGPPPPTNYTQYTFQQYPSPPPPQTVVAAQPMQTPQEFFRGGMAYYNMQVQPAPIRTHTKRPKAAIPILPPPELEPHGQKEDDDALRDDQCEMVQDISLDDGQVTSTEVAVES